MFLPGLQMRINSYRKTILLEKFGLQLLLLCFDFKLYQNALFCLNDGTVFISITKTFHHLNF